MMLLMRRNLPFDWQLFYSQNLLQDHFENTIKCYKPYYKLLPYFRLILFAIVAILLDSTLSFFKQRTKQAGLHVPTAPSSYPSLQLR